MDNESTVVALRGPEKSDLAFIRSSWLSSYRDGLAVRGVPHKIYYGRHEVVVRELLKRAYVMVLCLKNDPDYIAGWAVLEKTSGGIILHYVYVRGKYRRTGMARKLIELILEQEKPGVVFYSHRTMFVADYRRACLANDAPYPLKDWVYDPYLSFINLPTTWGLGPPIPIREETSCPGSEMLS